ncbi:Uncharacterised protein [Mycobacteroides abscessus subsp. abscessus]|nr:Uncharacterised protein [Mycobacteroides abscessus subsp. abscessus]
MSMMDSRLKPKSTFPSCQTPGSSGPRWRMCTIAASTAGLWDSREDPGGPSHATSPHTRPSMQHHGGRLRT